jgi:hypothetical protein
MAYIEENMKSRRAGERREASIDALASSNSGGEASTDPLSAADRLKSTAGKKAVEEGSVTNSLAMLTAIPEVDLGLE